ncbi:MAG: hypothetical protein HOO96_02195 [Polyangiaceae bacterium]|nr:hypothetical protein [Polyangiaceae bacterium]
MADLTPESPEELALAEELRQAMEEDREPFAASLRAALSPSRLDDDTHEKLIEEIMALGPIGEDEVESALPDAALEEALRAAISPAPLPMKEHDAIVARVFESAARRDAAPRGRVIRVAFGVSAVLAVAAAVLLWIRRPDTPEPRGASALINVRSTQPLFDEPFRSGEASARIDRIAMARSSDLRENRFSRWGLR